MTEAIRTVIADDADDLRMLVRMALELDGRFDVVGEAGDGEDALRLVDLHEPDLLLLDLAMPRMDGLEVLEHLQKRAQAPPVVVLSGFATAAMVDRALSLGATAYIEKGRDLGEIPQILADAYRSRA